MANHLYYGDNLKVLRSGVIAPESVDLIYLDPPFNSNADYSHIFKDESGNVSGAQIKAFDDTWHWDDMVSGQALAEVRDSPYQNAAAMLDAMVGFLGKNPMTAYLCMMAVRLVELHQVLKPTGSLYLHCDPTASHYLKVLLDAVFGAECFLNEIVWKRTFSHGSSHRYGPVHDIIFYYAKNGGHVWNNVRIDHESAYVEKHFKQFDAARQERFQAITLTGAGIRRGDSGKPWRGIDPTISGRHWALPRRILQKEGIEAESVQDRLEGLDAAGRILWPAKEGGTPRLKWFVSDLEGVAISDVWTDIPPISAHAKERLGYPTQKPVALMERILAASSNPGDVVLDPFCGCGTTVHAAQKMGRKWIGIDITHLAIGLIETRLYDAFAGQAEFTVYGVPSDIAGAQELFDRDDRTKKEFEKWAVRLIKAYAQGGGKKGADGGVDGMFRFGRDKEHKAVVSVKGGRSLGVGMIRDLDAVVTEQKAQIGVFLTLHPPTKPMLDWARGAGTFQVEGYDPVPRLQIVTVAEALEKGPRAVNTPLRHGDPYKRAPREGGDGGQGQLEL